MIDIDVDAALGREEEESRLGGRKAQKIGEPPFEDSCLCFQAACVPPTHPNTLHYFYYTTTYYRLILAFTLLRTTSSRMIRPRQRGAGVKAAAAVHLYQRRASCCIYFACFGLKRDVGWIIRLGADG
jgi:hypothetical protein